MTGSFRGCREGATQSSTLAIMDHCQYRLLVYSMRCLNGHGVEKDAGLAVRLLRLLEAKGSALAFYHLGKCYSQGEGVKKDEAKAFQ